MNAPVGPPICTLLPPKADTQKPPMMAVISPTVGVTPLAMPNAMASGNATMPTTIPATKSSLNLEKLYCFNVLASLGLNSIFLLKFITIFFTVMSRCSC